MKRLSPLSLCALAAGALALAGCAPPDGPEIEPETGAIQAGQLDTADPAVGYVTTANGLGCSGTLVSQSWVLTAKHCTGPGMVFSTGINGTNFVSHPIDQQIGDPLNDLMLAHLQNPIDDIAPIRFDTTGHVPAVGTTCTAVGFGAHLESDGKTTTSGVKRSATEVVTDSNPGTITVKAGTGIADHGDSGGPLLCNGIIEGVAFYKSPNVNYPSSYTLTYTTVVQWSWIEHTMAPVYQDLTLANGWVNYYGTRSPSAALVGNEVQLKGGISGGASSYVMNLPPQFRPQATVYVPVDLCGGANGRLEIDVAGNVYVEAQGAFSNAQCFTSLEGVFYATSPAGFTQLTLQNNWTPYSGTYAPGYFFAGGIVYFQGAMSNGPYGLLPGVPLFNLPAGMRPSVDLWINVDLCAAKKGRIVVHPSGDVTVEAESGSLLDATCFTSLEGASFSVDGTGFSTLTMQSGWQTYSAGSAAKAMLRSGVVRLKGSIQSGTGALAFTLPAPMRPSSQVLVPVDLCNAKKGRLVVNTSGTVMVLGSNTGTIADTQCFTSLDGVSFTASPWTPVTILSGGSIGPFGTARPAFVIQDGYVTFKGATGNVSGLAFELPPEARPSSTVAMPITMCGADKGQLLVTSTGLGVVSVQTGLPSPSCFASFEGVTYPISASGFTSLTPINGWKAYGTRAPAAKLTFGLVHLEGAIATTGTNTAPFVLPGSMAPSANIYVPIDLCNGAMGRLDIAPSGAVTVEAELGTFSNAQCFTSLEGVTFPVATTTYAPATLQNGWLPTPYGTRAAAFSPAGPFVRLSGAVTGGSASTLFQLPTGSRPSSIVYVETDLCNARNGRLKIDTAGFVSVEGDQTQANCFTSLDSVFFAL